MLWEPRAAFVPILLGETRGDVSENRITGKRLTGDVGVPIDERAVGILFPSPHVQGVKRGKSETIGRIKKVEELAHHLRRSVVVFVPLVGQNKVVGADELQAAIGKRFVDDDLRLGRVDDATPDECAVDEMHAHGAGVGTADATEHEFVTLGVGNGRIFEALGRLADELNELAGFVCLIERGGGLWCSCAGVGMQGLREGQRRTCDHKSNDEYLAERNKER